MSIELRSYCLQRKPDAFFPLNSAIQNPKSATEGLYPLAFYFVQHELKTRKTKAAASILKKHQTFTTAPDFSLPIESMAINSSTNRNYREAIDSFSSASVGRGKG